MRLKSRVRTLIVGTFCAVFLFSGSALAANYAFSFTTSGSQAGGYGTKVGGTSSVSLVMNPSSNVNSTRYIISYVASSDYAGISGNMYLNQPGSSRSTVYSSGGKNYGGSVVLMGTPSSVGAAANGTWNP